MAKICLGTRDGHLDTPRRSKIKLETRTLRCFKLLHYVCVAAFYLIAVPNSCDAGCPSGQTSATCFIFMYDTSGVNFATGESRCNSVNANLASVSSAAENAYILSIIPTWYTGNVLIGLTNNSVANTWNWTDQSASTYRNWNSGEPNNLNTEKCTEIYYDNFYGNPAANLRGFWNNGQCTSIWQGYICSYRCSQNSCYTNYNVAASSCSISSSSPCGSTCTSGLFGTTSYPASFVAGYSISPINIATGARFAVTFTKIDVENNYDFVQLWFCSSDQCSQYSSYTGSAAPSTIISATGVTGFVVVVTSDYAVEYSGFAVQYYVARSGDGCIPIPFPSSIFQLQNLANPSYCLSDGGETYNGQGTYKMATCSSAAIDQQFLFNAANNSIRNPNRNDLCLDTCGSGGSGSNCYPHAWTCGADLNALNNQVFFYYPSTHLLWNPWLGLCLDDNTLSADHIVMGPCASDNVNQQWAIVPISVSCSSGSYSSQGGCVSCPSCSSGSYLSGCTGTSAGTCLSCASQTCASGYYRSSCSGTSAGTCVSCAIQTCASGYYVSGCQDTSSGTCTSCTSCPAGEYNQGCGVGNSGSCQACASCPTGYYRTGCSGISAGSCVACQSCSDQYYNSGCGGTSSGMCTACPSDSDCLSGQYRAGCSGLSSGYCAFPSCATCGVGQYLSGCSGSSPGSCVTCAPCGSGQYMSGCGGASPGSCVSCTSCQSGEYLSGCSGNSAGTCISCNLTSCVSGQQYLNGCGGTSPGTCASCASCPANQYLSGCSGVAAGTCISCASQSCPAGKYLSGCGGTSPGTCNACVSCPSGQYLSGCSGSTAGTCISCQSVPCPSGQYLSGCGGTSQGACFPCTSCPSSAYLIGCSSGSAGTCISCASSSCPSGQFLSGCGGNSSGTCTPLNCVSCAAGQYLHGCSGNNSGSCVSCSAISCPPGKVLGGCGGNSAGYCIQQLCTTSCPSGFYLASCTEDSGGSCIKCPSCPAGQIISGCEGSRNGTCTQCTSTCSSGQYSTLSGCYNCSDCSPGTFSLGPGTTSCQYCVSGSYFSGTGSSQCHSCTAGSYSSTIGSIVCNECGAGKYSSTTGASSQTSCLQCSAGYFSTSTGATSIEICTSCSPGTYSSGSGASAIASCQGCSAGAYAPVSASTVCMICPNGTYSTQRASSCAAEDTVIRFSIGLQMSQSDFQNQETKFIRSVAQAVDLPDSAVTVTSVSQVVSRRLLAPSVTVGASINTIAALQSSVASTLGNSDILDTYLASNGLPGAIPGSLSVKLGNSTNSSPAPSTSSSGSTSSSSAGIVGGVVGAFGAVVIAGLAFIAWRRTHMPTGDAAEKKIPMENMPESGKDNQSEATGQNDATTSAFVVTVGTGDQGNETPGLKPSPTVRQDSVANLKTNQDTDFTPGLINRQGTVSNLNPRPESAAVTTPSAPSDSFTRLTTTTVLADDERKTIMEIAAQAQEGPHSRLCEATYDLIIGKPKQAVNGLNELMHVDEMTLSAAKMKGLKGLEEEVSAFCGLSEDPEAKEIAKWLHYILHEETSEGKFENGVRDSDRAKMKLADFCGLSKAKEAKLVEAEVAAIRLYTTMAYKFMNIPLRDAARQKEKRAVPLPATTFWAQSGIKKLRALNDEQTRSGTVIPLWRGMRNISETTEFMNMGGTELAFMSTSEDLKVAARYSLNGQVTKCLLFKFLPTTIMATSANVEWVSVFPNERERLYPPLTFLQPVGKETLEAVRGNGEKVEVTVILINPTVS